MKKNLLIDINCVLQPSQINNKVNGITFQPMVFQYLSRLNNELDYTLVLVKDITDVQKVNELLTFCQNEKISFSEILPIEDLSRRIKIIGNENVTFICSPSYLGAAAPEVERIVFGEDASVPTGSVNWASIYKVLSTAARKAQIVRTTSETDIDCSVNLDGAGIGIIDTGLGFFDHMLQQIARHANIDLTIKVKGDLHIDEHHTIEDVGLALGATINEALGNKRGIDRYGFLLPMDDCLAQVAIDFGGRPWLVWDAPFSREMIGDMPTEMFYHFFKSFTDTARCNLNIKAEGSNEHHKIESIFKAFAKSIGMAIRKNDNNNIPSTKGSL